MVTMESAEYIEAYRWLKLGFLPNSGGWLSQTNKFLAVVRIIDSEIRKLENKDGGKSV